MSLPSCTQKETEASVEVELPVTKYIRGSVRT
jgi:hypothetical protein